ncbi:MAG TPA: EcsC family protein [Polyangiales bacterium]
MELSFEDREALLRAKLILEHPGLAARIGEILGKPIEVGLNSLPARVQQAIGAATQAALQLGLHAAVSTLPVRPAAQSSTLHKWVGGLAGAAGGFFGVLALPAELPLSTLIILRAIAAIACSEGEDMRLMEARLACLEVLGLGSTTRPRNDGNGAETAYYAARIGLAQSVTRAAEYITQHGLATKAAPPVAELLTRIAARFSMRVTEEVIAKAVPVVGAASGAAINALFIHHFQEMARAHFTIRRLERTYGAEPIQRVYERLEWRYSGIGPGPAASA